jgi:hypothetical protein
MNSLRIALLAGVALLLAIPGPADVARADGGRMRSFDADLDGYDEIPLALSTTGSGELRVRISRDRTQFDYRLSYEDLEGAITQAHIHFGRRGVNGAIVVWLCGTAAFPGPANTPSCPAGSSGEVTGTITAAQVQTIAAQGIAANEFDALLAAMGEGATYANVHTEKYGGGEVRGQIQRGDRH